MNCIEETNNSLHNEDGENWKHVSVLQVRIRSPLGRIAIITLVPLDASPPSESDSSGKIS